MPSHILSEVERTKEKSYLTPSAYDKSMIEIKSSTFEESLVSSWHMTLREDTREMSKCLSPLAM